MNNEKGDISIHAEGLFPIIKKWLYSDRDIFVRELISNGCDAISKLKRLAMMGEASVPDDEKYYVRVKFNSKEKTLKFIDNGLGMTEDEVKKYINQVAFSGAKDFMSKYKDKMDKSNDIIGHFGLGFYSAFMVSENVEIDTLSYKKDAEAVKWQSDGGTEYSISASDKTYRGTVITLHLNSDSEEFLSEYKLKEIIKKHCSFLPTEIYVEDENPKKDENAKDEDKKEEEKPLNDTHPLWLKSPNECTDEEYKEFYKKLFNDYRDPLFWIHLNVDYPFNLKGILYFPKIDHEITTLEGQIKLYNNQVFVADNIKEVIPEFLMLLKGAIDCSDLPLNVSRSFLQNDRTVAKISKHITKKVADKLTDLYKKEKKRYEEIWNDINVFIKYGCMRDEDFYSKVKDIIIFKTTNGDYVNLKEYLDRNKDKHENKVFYVDDVNQQSQYIKMFKENNLEAIVVDSRIDTNFMSFLEMKESGTKFNRIDSDISDTLKDKEADESNKEEVEKESKTLGELFKGILNNDKMKVEVESLKNEETPAMILMSEEARRMQELSKMYKDLNIPNTGVEETLVLNRKNSLVKAILDKNGDESKKDDIKLIGEQIYDLALMSNKQLNAEEMSRFIERSNKILSKLL